MTVNEFPSAVLSPEDTGHSEADRGKLGTATHLGSKSFDFHYTGKSVRDMPRHGLKPEDLSFSIARRSSGPGL
jgi:hypothetical protein